MKKHGLTLIAVMICFCTAAQANEELPYAGQLRAVDPDSGAFLLPLKETRVTINISANIAVASISQVFYNDSDMNLEAIYTFPLPAGATVTDMELIYDDHRIRSVVQEKTMARHTYQKAKSVGKRAALLEQDMSQLFKTSVANFQPGEEVTVTFSYMEQLPFNGRVYEVTFPTTFGPKYMPEMVELPDVQLVSLAMPAPLAFTAPRVANPGHTLSLQAFVRGLPICNIYSNTHDILVEETDFEQFSIELAHMQVMPDRDLTLKLELMDEEQPQISFLQSDGPSGVHGMVTLFPPLSDNSTVETLPKEVVFLIDTSGSMDGQSMHQAKEGLKECLLMLNDHDRFNIVRFSNDYSSLHPSFTEYDQANEEAALAYIHQLHADGGTEMQKAMSYVLNLPQTPGYMRMVVFLTDGDVGNEVSLMRLVDHQLGDARIFSFGVGSAPNEYLLRKLSETGYGVANFIKTDDDIGEVMSDFFETVSSPVLTDVSLTWRNQDGSLFEDLTMFPSVVPDVFLNRPVQLCYRYTDYFNGSLEITGFMNGQEVNYNYHVDQTGKHRFTGIEKLFGQAMVNDGMLGWTNARDSAEQAIWRQDVVDTALAYQLVTPFTSRVAVEEKTRQVEPAQTVAVPLMKKEGALSGSPQFAATATANPLLLLLGALALAMGISGSIILNRVSS